MLKPEKADEYFKEIIEGGGAPSVLEIARLAAELKAAQHYSSVYKIRKYARENLSKLTGESFEEDAAENKEAKFSDSLCNATTLLNKG